MVRPAQDDVTRRRRLDAGRCPTHGLALTQVGIELDDFGDPCGDRVECPRRGCSFVTTARRGTKLYKALRA
jgi:hypothetical protein